MPLHPNARTGLLPSAVCVAALAAPLTAVAQTQTTRPPAGPAVALDPIAGGGGPYTAVAASPNDRSVIYALTKAGRVRLVRNGALAATAVVDFSSAVRDGGESGALGLALHPNFATNGWLYVFHSGTGSSTFVARYTVSLPTGTTADPATRQTVLVLPVGASIHNGGWIGFGPDGLLSISRGDTGTSTLAQRTDTLNGKILRIDVDGDDFPTDDARNYWIPAGNPFAAPDDGVLDEILHLGVRNPWRCSFDRASGDFWIDDVGEGQREEIDRVAPGEIGLNFGWECREGFVVRRSGCTVPPSGFTPPVFDIERSVMNCSIGGYVYRGCRMPSLVGRYVFASCSGEIFSINPDAPGGSMLRHGFAPTSILGFGEDADGELMVCAGSSVYRLRQTTVTLTDCNANGAQDACDIASGSSNDHNRDGVPDECGPCFADFDGEDGLTVVDLFTYLRAFFNQEPRADIDGRDGVVAADIFLFLAAWFAGC